MEPGVGVTGQGEARDRSAVSADMEAIFGPAAAAGVSPDVGRSLVAAAPARRRRGPVVLVAIVAAAAVGLAIEWPRHTAPAPAAAPVSLPLSAPATRVVPPPVAPPPVITPASAPAPAVTPPPAPVLPARVTPVAHPPRAAPSAAALDRQSRRRYAFDDDMPVRGRCAGLDRYSRHACLLDALENSDRRLRRAYDDAIDAGVSRADLSSRRARWAALRRQAPRRPAYVVAAYDSLADELYTLGARRR